MKAKLFLRLLLATAFASGPVLAGLPEGTDLETATWVAGHSNYSGAVTSSGSPYWIETSDSLDGSDAVVGRLDGVNGNAVSSWIQTSVTGPTTLYFSWRVKNFTSSYSGGSFKVNGNTLAVSSRGLNDTDTGWHEGAIAVPAGTSAVLWGLEIFRGATPVNAYLDQVWTSEDPRPRLVPGAVPSGNFGVPYSWEVPTAGGAIMSLSATGLPTGLTVDPVTHVISGTPVAAGTFESTLVATNTAGAHRAKMTFEIAPGATTIPLGLDAPTLAFSHSTFDEAVWSGVTGIGHDGVDSASVAEAKQQDPLSFFPTFHILSTQVSGPGTLSFWWKRSLYGIPYDSNSFPPDRTTLSCFLNYGTSGSTYLTGYPARGSGTDWIHESVLVPDGSQTISWLSSRTADLGNAGVGVVNTAPLHSWIDQIRWVPSSVGPQPTFAAWQSAWNVAGQEATADGDADGLNLLQEYAFGGSPFTSNAGLLPTVSVSDGFAWIHVKKAPGTTDLTYVVQTSRDLVANSWTSVQVEVTEEDGTHLLARVPVSGGPRYLRVKVLL